MVTVKYSTNYKAVEARLRNLPKFMPKLLECHAMKYAVAFIKVWKDGIKRNDLGLIPLSSITIEAKEKMIFLKGRGRGKRKAEVLYKKPETPLYGAGLDIDKKTYINMLRIVKKASAYHVVPSRAKHHKSSLTLKQLFDIHEKGRTIAKKDGTLIRIPPRPAFFLAYRRFLMERAKQDPAKKFRSEISKYIKTGESKYFAEVVNKKNEGDKHKE